jgi:oligopeptide/dipeptide ABC transporter ATP-binding protein
MLESAVIEPLLQVDGLAKHYPVGKSGGLKRFVGKAVPPSYLHAVDNVDLRIGVGETVGLVGESGCGKSTLVRLLTRMIDPTDGRIALEGQDIGAMPAKGFGKRPERARVQMVFQDAEGSLNPRYTAADAIGEPLKKLRLSLDAAGRRARVEELADLCGLPRPLLSRFPHQLSGGQKARVGIARAIAVEPKLLILDEPTAALDVSVQVVILQLLQDLKRRLGMSYLFVSHDLHVVHLLCDRVMVMYLGKIIESGPAHEIFTAPAHPYTKALVSAIPTFEPGLSKARLRLGGEPRSPIDPDPNVCRFFGRCPKGTEACAQRMPILRPAGYDRAVACHFPEIEVPPEVQQVEVEETPVPALRVVHG